jgi:D-3-phosphoglycerate dehydrogenase
MHVPETANTKDMIGAEELAQMKPGALLINASRGTVIDIPALCDALRSKHLSGAAIDVFPEEPATNSDPFTSPLCEFDNVILTPHIGGSTMEAQEGIGLEVAGKLAKYSDNGSTLSAVNFPEASLPTHSEKASRLLHIHENRPGVLTSINQIFAEQGINIAAQYLQTSPEVGYVVIDRY